MSDRDCADTFVIKEFLSLLACDALSPFLQDFGIPEQMVRRPDPLRDSARATLATVSSLEGAFFDVTARANESFADFLAHLAEFYERESVDKFINWTRRHRVDHDCWVIYSVWSPILGFLDGLRLRLGSLDNDEQILQAVHQRLIDFNPELDRSWFDGTVASIQQSLKSNELAVGRCPHLSLDAIHEILDVERCYRYVLEAKTNCNEAERRELLVSARAIAEGLGWSRSLLAKLSL